MAHFDFVISQNAKWGHAGFYIDCHRMTVPENILLQKKHWHRAVCSIRNQIRESKVIVDRESNTLAWRVYRYYVACHRGPIAST